MNLQGPGNPAGPALNALEGKKNIDGGMKT